MVVYFIVYDDDLSVVVGFEVVVGFGVVDIGVVDIGVVDFGVVDFGVVGLGVVDFGVVVAVFEEKFEEILAETLVDWLDDFVITPAQVDWLVSPATTAVLVD